MKKYDEYKDSGVAWIGDVPKHWEVKQLKWLFYNLDNLREPISADKRERTNPQYEYYGASGVIDKIDYYNVDDRVLLIGEDGANLVFRNLPLIYKAEGKFWVNNHAHILKPMKNVDYGYMYYTLEAADYSTFITGSAQPKLSQSNLELQTLPVPPYYEQVFIATYLDTHCAKIDNLISIQQKRIALLQELKQSVITHAVTKGLNPNVEMKQSGVEWIGDVPKHWEVMPIKYIADTNSGATPKNIKGRQNERSDIKWVRTTDLSDICDYVYDSSEYLSREEMKSASCPWLPKNTVVVAMYGGSGTIGKAGILGCDSTINQALCSLETTKLEDYRYLYYNIKSLRPYWMKLAASSRKDPNISQEIIRNMDVPVPGIDEQTKIVQYLDRKCTTINTSISNAQHQIDLLQEYKQSLITEVVTGKRKVTDN